MADGKPGLGERIATQGPMVWSMAIGIMVCAILALVATVQGRWSAELLGPVFTAALGLLAGASLVSLFTELGAGRIPELRTHWGGLGGGIGGWSMSPALVYFAMSLLFGGGAFVSLQTTSDAQAKHDTAKAALVAEAVKAAEAARVAAEAAGKAGDAAAAQAAARAASDAAAKAKAAADATSTGANGVAAATAPAGAGTSATEAPK